MKIAGKLTIKDWEDLEELLEINDNKNWSLAFHFFEERIKTRYLNPINAIMKLNENLGEGFAVVNLQCSLIETIESFINGWKFSIEPYGWFKKEITKGKNDENVKKNQDLFVSFFKNREPFKFNNTDGEDFYKSVRCGLLHETQTKNGWTILADGYEKSIDYKIIYRNNFQRDLEKLIENYKDSIIKGENFDNIESIDLRKNFISKFNHICKQS